MQKIDPKWGGFKEMNIIKFDDYLTSGKVEGVRLPMPPLDKG